MTQSSAQPRQSKKELASLRSELSTVKTAWPWNRQPAAPPPPTQEEQQVISGLGDQLKRLGFDPSSAGLQQGVPQTMQGIEQAFGFRRYAPAGGGTGFLYDPSKWNGKGTPQQIEAADITRRINQMQANFAPQLRQQSALDFSRQVAAQQIAAQNPGMDERHLSQAVDRAIRSGQAKVFTPEEMSSQGFVHNPQQGGWVPMFDPSRGPNAGNIFHAQAYASEQQAYENALRNNDEAALKKFRGRTHNYLEDPNILPRNLIQNDTVGPSGQAPVVDYNNLPGEGFLGGKQMGGWGQTANYLRGANVPQWFFGEQGNEFAGNLLGRASQATGIGGLSPAAGTLGNLTNLMAQGDEARYQGALRRTEGGKVVAGYEHQLGLVDQGVQRLLQEHPEMANDPQVQRMQQWVTSGRQELPGLLERGAIEATKRDFYQNHPGFQPNGGLSYGPEWTAQAKQQFPEEWMRRETAKAIGIPYLPNAENFGGKVPGMVAHGGYAQFNGRQKNDAGEMDFSGTMTPEYQRMYDLEEARRQKELQAGGMPHGVTVDESLDDPLARVINQANNEVDPERRSQLLAEQARLQRNRAGNDPTKYDQFHRDSLADQGIIQQWEAAGNPAGTAETPEVQAARQRIATRGQRSDALGKLRDASYKAFNEEDQAGEAFKARLMRQQLDSGQTLDAGFTNNVNQLTQQYVQGQRAARVQAQRLVDEGHPEQAAQLMAQSRMAQTMINRDIDSGGGIGAVAGTIAATATPGWLNPQQEKQFFQANPDLRAEYDSALKTHQDRYAAATKPATPPTPAAPAAGGYTVGADESEGGTPPGRVGAPGAAPAGPGAPSDGRPLDQIRGIFGGQGTAPGASAPQGLPAQYAATMDRFNQNKYLHQKLTGEAMSHRGMSPSELQADVDRLQGSFADRKPGSEWRTPQQLAQRAAQQPAKPIAQTAPPPTPSSPAPTAPGGLPTKSPVTPPHLSSDLTPGTHGWNQAWTQAQQHPTPPPGGALPPPTVPPPSPGHLPSGGNSIAAGANPPPPGPPASLSGQARGAGPAAGPQQPPPKSGQGSLSAQIRGRQAAPSVPKTGNLKVNLFTSEIRKKMAHALCGANPNIAPGPNVKGQGGVEGSPKLRGVMDVGTGTPNLNGLGQATPIPSVTPLASVTQNSPLGRAAGFSGRQGMVGFGVNRVNAKGVRPWTEARFTLTNPKDTFATILFPKPLV